MTSGGGEERASAVKSIHSARRRPARIALMRANGECLHPAAEARRAAPSPQLRRWLQPRFYFDSISIRP